MLCFGGASTQAWRKGPEADRHHLMLTVKEELIGTIWGRQGGQGKYVTSPRRKKGQRRQVWNWHNFLDPGVKVTGVNVTGVKVWAPLNSWGTETSLHCF